MKQFGSVCAGACLAIVCLPAAADDHIPDEDRQAPVVIEGSRLDQTRAEYGSSVSVLTAETIELLGERFAADVLARLPGVTVNQTGAFGGAANVRIRGAGSEQTLVLIDGMPVNDPTTPGGGYDFSRLDTDAIERIEVLKGPQSTLWGSDAIGGVVSIITRRPEPGLSGTSFAEYGSFDTVRTGTALNAGSGTARLRLAATATDSDGISKADEANGNTEKDGYEAWTVSARGGLDLPAGITLDGSLLYTEAETGFDSFVFGAQGNVGDGDEISETEGLSTYFTLAIPQFSQRLSHEISLGYAETDRRNFSDGVASFSTEGERRLLRYQGSWAASKRVLIALGAEREDVTSGSEDTTIDGLFVLAEIKPDDRLTLTGGLRSDDHEVFGSETTARLAAAYEVSDQLGLRASWGEGFKAPTLFQTTFLCCGATAPNADLMAETSEAFDVGADWTGFDERLALSLTYFQQDTENLIVFGFDIGGYRNESQVEQEGVELSASLQISDMLTLTGNQTWIDAVTGDGTDLPNLPETTTSLGLEIDPDGPFSGGVFLRHNGGETDFSGGKVGSWTRMDASLRYAVSDRVELYGRIENAFDTAYQQVLGYGTPGRSGTIGLRVRY